MDHKDVNVTIDGVAITVPHNTRILEAARKAGAIIPTLCDHPDLCKRGVCRICVVECDGRGKLFAACTNDVWEGVNIITHNERILNIRKMIIELILANHPQDCLSCIRNKNCELQKLAAELDVRHSPFHHHQAAEHQPITEHNTLVRDMGKCVKCGRCVEMCQEVQTIRSINSSHRGAHYGISAPYDQALADGPCVFCGQCAKVCPVGAIYEYDQSAEAWAMLSKRESPVAVQIAPQLSGAFDEALSLPPGTVSPGKLVTALKRLGFDNVFDTKSFAAAARAALNDEVVNRIKNKGTLPLISGCTAGCIKFVKDSYPDLAGHLSVCTKSAPATAVSVSDCAAHKFQAPDGGHPLGALSLTVNELARMFTLSGVDFNGLPETAFDTDTGRPAETALPEANPSDYKTITAHGFAQARIILDSVRRGECDASLVEIKSCPQFF